MLQDQITQLENQLKRLWIEWQEFEECGWVVEAEDKREQAEQLRERVNKLKEDLEGKY